MAPDEPSHLQRPTVAILGLGTSGYAAARLALDRGEIVHVSDTRSDASTSARGEELRTLGARVELGGHDVAVVARADTVVVSPGISPDAPVLRVLRERGVRWIAEPEFAFRFLQGALIAVTGTNGKTTVSALTAHLLEVADIPVGLGGNIGAGLGPPASELARLDPPPAWHVMEMSSFQLADIEHFRPDIGVLTNLAPDHLDRYPDVESYYRDKGRLFLNADPGSRWVLNGDDPGVLDLAGDAAGERYHFTLGHGWGDATRSTGSGTAGGSDGAGRSGEPAGSAGSGMPAGSGRSIGSGAVPGGEGATGSGGTAPPDDRIRGRGFVRDGILSLEIEGQIEPLAPWDAVPLLGIHNRANALAAALAARLAGAPPDALGRGLRSARALPHRLEPVAETGGVLWVNDSKATNVAAAVSAVRSLEGRRLVVLLGGKDKGEDLGPLRDALRGRCRAVVAYGAAGERLARALEGGADGIDAPVVRLGDDFGAVVRRARELARSGDVVLLAPACSSFDMFQDYQERGRVFREMAAEANGAGRRA